VKLPAFDFVQNRQVTGRQVRQAKEFEILVAFVWGNVSKSNSGSRFAWRVVRSRVATRSHAAVFRSLGKWVATEWHGMAFPWQNRLAALHCRSVGRSFYCCVFRRRYDSSGDVKVTRENWDIEELGETIPGRGSLRRMYMLKWLAS